MRAGKRCKERGGWIGGKGVGGRKELRAQMEGRIRR